MTRFLGGRPRLRRNMLSSEKADADADETTPPIGDETAAAAWGLAAAAAAAATDADAAAAAAAAADAADAAEADGVAGAASFTAPVSGVATPTPTPPRREYSCIL